MREFDTIRHPAIPDGYPSTRFAQSRPPAPYFHRRYRAVSQLLRLSTSNSLSNFPTRKTPHSNRLANRQCEMIRIAPNPRGFNAECISNRLYIVEFRGVKFARQNCAVFHQEASLFQVAQPLLAMLPAGKLTTLDPAPILKVRQANCKHEPQTSCRTKENHHGSARHS
jgi:hypothetical protein